MAKTVKTLIIGLENPWPENTPVGGFVDGMEYTQLGPNVYIYGHITPGPYKTSLDYDLYLIKHMRIFGDLSKEDICSKYPILSKWINSKWPVLIGRYKFTMEGNNAVISDTNIKYIVDVVFGERKSESTALTLPYDLKWTPEYKKEIVDGNYGYWPGWSYDLKSYSLAELTMNLIMKIPEKDRVPYKIVRYLTAYCNERNSSDGLLYGMWDQNIIKSKSGKEPSYWKSTSHVLNVRCQKSSPVKYAQCWVFSEILTSMFRYLRIPSRTIYAKNARIDRGCDGGIDLDLVIRKGEDSSPEEVIIDIWSMMEETINKADTVNITVIEKNQDISNNCVIISKGEEKAIPTINIQGNVSFTPIDFVKTDDSSWNFHVWNETFIERPDLKSPYSSVSWNCSDASPSIKTTDRDLFPGGYVLGPCCTKSIKDGEEQDYDFLYLNSAVNGVYRFWKSSRITSSEGDSYDVIYPSFIAYNSLTREGVVQRKVEIFTRDTVRSCGIVHIIKDEITDSYLHDSQIAYKIHHKKHPIMVKWKPNTTATFEIQVPINSTFYVQICYLKVKELLSYYRTSISDWSQLLIPEEPPGATKLSIFIASPKERKWWAQVV